MFYWSLKMSRACNSLVHVLCVNPCPQRITTAIWANPAKAGTYV